MSLADSVRSNLGPTFADDLRARSDEELAELFKARPDLINPIPADLTTLASRATSAPSLIRAIEGLNQWQIQVLEVASLFEDSFTASEIAEMTTKEASAVLSQLVTLGLLYKDSKKFRIPRAVRDILGEYVGGLGPSIAQEIDFKALAKAPSGAVELLERLMWGPPRGELGDVHKKGGAIEWLLKNRFLSNHSMAPPFLWTSPNSPRGGPHMRRSNNSTAPLGAFAKALKSISCAMLGPKPPTYSPNMSRTARGILNFFESL